MFVKGTWRSRPRIVRGVIGASWRSPGASRAGPRPSARERSPKRLRNDSVGVPSRVHAGTEPRCETLRTGGADLSEPEYLRHIEHSARELVNARSRRRPAHLRRSVGAPDAAPARARRRDSPPDPPSPLRRRRERRAILLGCPVFDPDIANPGEATGSEWTLGRSQSPVRKRAQTALPPSSSASQPHAWL